MAFVNEKIPEEKSIVGKDTDRIEKIISGGYTEDGNWIRMEGGKCGFGDFLSIEKKITAKAFI